MYAFTGSRHKPHRSAAVANDLHVALHLGVDTSIWIDHGRRRDDQLSAWLTEGLVLGHPFVQRELACGQMPRRAEVLALFEALPPATVVSHHEALQFLERHRLMGRGLGWIDLHLLASALVSRATLATRDALR